MPKSIRHQEMLMCGGKKCCPVLTTFTDGSIDLTDTDDGKDERIHLDPSQVQMLRDLLAKLP
jgi:hypothetical protein